jgi:hypothetical protein
MTKEKTSSFDEPKTYTIAKFRLLYSIIVVVGIVGVMIFDKTRTPMICFGLVALFAIYLFLPFTYRLIISDEAISSINLFGAKTLEWNEIGEIKIKNGNVLLSNRDGDVKITVNQQIDDYSEAIKFIQQQRPELWLVDDINTFHQNSLESMLSVFIGFGILMAGVQALLKDGFTSDSLLPVVFFIGMSIFLVINGLFGIHKLSFEQDTLIVYYLVWKRQFLVQNILSVGLEQEYGKNTVTYPVHIKIKGKKDIVVKNIKEGNPIFVSAAEAWMKKYKGKQND